MEAPQKAFSINPNTEKPKIQKPKRAKHVKLIYTFQRERAKGLGHASAAGMDKVRELGRR